MDQGEAKHLGSEQNVVTHDAFGNLLQCRRHYVYARNAKKEKIRDH